MKGSWHRPALFLGLLGAALTAWLFLDGRLVPGEWGRGYLINRNWAQATAGLGKPVAALWILGLWAWVARRNRAALTGLAALLLSGVVVTLPKELFRRVRPSATHSSPAELAQWANYPDSRSFPSGDTAQAVAMATALGPGLPLPWRVGVFGLAGVVGFKRYLDHAHYLSDVLAGAALGLLAGWVALGLDRRFLGRPPPRFWRRRPWHFWVLVGVAVGEPVIDPYLFTHALKAWGPFLVVGLLLARGRQWLRWSSGPDRSSPALLGLLCLGALSLLPGILWCAKQAVETGSYLETVTALSADPFSAGALGSWAGVPLGPWLSGVLGALARDPLAGARLLSGLAALGALACLFTLGRHLAGPRAGTLAGALLVFSLTGGLLGRLALPTTVLASSVLLAALGIHLLLSGARQRGTRVFAIGAALAGLTGGAPALLLTFLGLALAGLWPGSPALPWKALLPRLLGAALLPCLAWLALASLAGASTPLASWLQPPHPGGWDLSPWLVPLLAGAGLWPWLALSRPFWSRQHPDPQPGPDRAFRAGQIGAMPVVLLLPLAPLSWQAALWIGPLALLATASRRSPAEPGGERGGSRTPGIWAALSLLALLALWRFCDYL